VVNFPALCHAQTLQGMDVRCEQCKTLYELDEARVSEAGTTVRCTTCGHVFRVRKKVLLMTEAVGVGGESTAVPPPLVEKPAWRVRSPSGRVIGFRELTSMQKWIVERKFGREDEISLHGDHWKRLGDIAELQPFFLLLDEVDRVHALEERLRRAELPDEAPSRLEEELSGSSPPPPPATPARPAPTPTPIRLETPIEPPPAPARESGPDLGPPGFVASAPPSVAETPRIGTPSAFSLEEIREATRPSPDDLPMPEGPVEPQAPAEDAEQPQFTRRAGLGIEPGAVDDSEGWDPPRRSKAPWVALVLILAAVGVAAAAYFQIWVPAQAEKLRQEAQRARLEDGQKARAAGEAEVREREQHAKEELLAGMAQRADAGTPTAAPAGAPVDAGTGGSAAPEAPRGSADAPGPGTPTAPASTVDARPRASPAPEPRPRSFEAWMAQGDRERAHARVRAALDAYDRAIALDPARPEAHLAQGRALLDIGDARSAIAAFRHALGANPRYSVAEFWLGEAYRRAGQASEATAAYRRYLDAAPEGAEAARAREALNAVR
jgi:predicted Zn finger-like uncharacterized protein